MNVSGLYERQDMDDLPFTREILRLDVDGAFPQMAASGAGFFSLQFETHWVARQLTKTATPDGDEWSGPIAHKFGNVDLLPHDAVVIRQEGDHLRVTFRRTGFSDRVRDFAFKSPRFREVVLEYDAEQEVERVLEYQTHSHPGRPASLTNETLTLDAVFERAGFHVMRTGEDGVIPSSGSGVNDRWSDNEMHDAMQVHFSRLASLPPSQRNAARWALWTFFAKRYHEAPGDPDGSTGGIMFDRIGAAHRQGTAVFRESFIANVPTGELQPEVWRQRMAFWTAVHEMGHSFNLLHAWQKHLGTPWIPQPSGFSLRTFMNYPYFYETGPGINGDANTIRFFRDFEFRFTDDELLFLRHAPERFVIMGGEQFGADHAFEQARVSPAPVLTLEVRVNRKNAVFEFMEPVVIELKLKNTSDQPDLIPDRLLSTRDQLTIQVRKRGGEAKTYQPFATYCYEGKMRVLEAGESVYDSLFVSVDQHEWLVDSPGYYSIQACMHLPDEDILSAPLQIRVTPPRQREEEYIAQDYFSEDVGRILTFDGSQVLTKANDILREVVAQLPKSNAAIHAQVTLDLPRVTPYKLLNMADAPRGSRYAIQEINPVKAETEQLSKLLGEPKGANDVAQALGHIDYRYYTERLSEALKQQDHEDKAQEVVQCMHDTLKGRGVKGEVLEDIAETIKANIPAKKKAHRKKLRGGS